MAGSVWRWQARDAGEPSSGIDYARFGDRAGTMGAVGAAGELQDHGAVDQAVEEGRRQRWVAKVVGPAAAVDVGRKYRRTPASPSLAQPIITGPALPLPF